MRSTKLRSVSLLVVGAMSGGWLLSPASAHVTGVPHLWGGHIKDKVQTLLANELGTADAAVNQAGDPVHWTRLMGVPSGFADGTDNVGGTGSDLVCTGCVDTTDIADSAVTSAKVAADTLTAADLATGAVGTAEILDGTIATADLADSSVTGAKVALDTLTAADIATGAVTTTEIADGTIATADLADSSVTGAKVAADTLTAADLATGSVGTDEILNGTITGADLAPDIVVNTAVTRNVAGSFQPIASDLTLGASAGTSAALDSDFLAPIMGNVLDDGAALTKTKNFVGGVIGHYTVTTTPNASTYPVGAVLAGIGDDSDTADGAVVAYIDGDSGAPTSAGAAFKVMSNNSTATNGFNFGLDLQDAAHDGYVPVDEAFYKDGLIRLPTDVVILVKNGAPVGADGAGDAGPGSLLVDRMAGKLYINTGTIGAPVWTVVGTQV